MTEQSGKPLKLTTQQKRLIRYAYELLTGQQDPEWVKNSPEPVKLAYRAGMQVTLNEMVTALYPTAKRFNAEIFKRELFDYHREQQDNQ